MLKQLGPQASIPARSLLSMVLKATVSAWAVCAMARNINAAESNTAARSPARSGNEYPMSSPRSCGAARDRRCIRASSNVAHRVTGLDHAQRFALSQPGQRDKSATNAVAGDRVRTDTDCSYGRQAAASASARSGPARESLGKVDPQIQAVEAVVSGPKSALECGI